MSLPPPNQIVVETSLGTVCGSRHGTILRFLGIPYARPPVGELRWMPPQPTGHFGRLNAHDYGNTSPQASVVGSYAGPTSVTEDCLYLNVFSPDVAAKSPVIVFVHGGGNFTGASDHYDGSRMAADGGIVLVTINYRLGILGFFSHPSLIGNDHPSGNYGIMDIQAALAWVKAEIGAFGGDPDNMTLAGHSAGSMNVAANLLSPDSKGLFSRAILQSPPVGEFPTGEAALAKGIAFAKAAKCDTAADLRQLSVARILQLQGRLHINGPYATHPFVDGRTIPIQPMQAWQAGEYNQMPIMGGNTEDEGLFDLSIETYFGSALSEAEFQRRNTAEVIEAYPLGRFGGNPTLAQNRIDSDSGPYGMTTMLAVLKAIAATNPYPTYGYVFSYKHAPYYFPQMENPYDPSGFFQPLAAHTIDLQFFFPDYHGGPLGVNLDPSSGQPRQLTASELELSRALVGWWANFAATGDPNGPDSPAWPSLRADAPVFLVQDIPIGLKTEADYVNDFNCKFWQERSRRGPQRA